MDFNNFFPIVEIALVKGKQTHDKRESLKQRDQEERLKKQLRR